MSPKRVTLALLFTVAGATASGCDRTYLTPSHGRSYRQAFAAQTVNPDRRADATTVHGLDAQEAGIISAGYRKALSPKDAAVSPAGGTQLLMYSPGAGMRDANVPPPSVPAER